MQPPSPAPTAATGQKHTNSHNGATASSDALTTFAAVIIAMLALIIVSLGVYLWLRINKTRHSEMPVAYATKPVDKTCGREMLELEI